MTTPKEALELKPCPFCGGEAESDSQRYYRNISSGNLEKAAAIYCTKCSADMTWCYRDTPEIERDQVMTLLVEQWNTRTASIQGEDAVERVAGCICQNQHRRGYCTEPGCPYSTSDAVERVARSSNRIWFDTEFIEDGKTIDLISIGMVRSDGRTYYAETDQWVPGRASQWVKDNVLVHLKGGDAIKPRDVIAREIVEFAGEKPEFWAYYADYDWVALCQLYGTMMQLPDGWPMFCRDIKQRCVDLGNPKLPEQTGAEHHALADALWNKQAWEFLATGLVPDEAAARADEREKCAKFKTSDISDQDMRDLLSCKDIASGRAMLKRLVPAAIRSNRRGA